MTYIKTVIRGRRVRITRPGKQNGKTGIVETITNENMVLVRMDSKILLPCWFGDFEEIKEV